MSGEIFSCQLAGGGIVDAKDAAGHPPVYRRACFPPRLVEMSTMPRLKAWLNFEIINP